MIEYIKRDIKKYFVEYVNDIPKIYNSFSIRFDQFKDTLAKKEQCLDCQKHLKDLEVSFENYYSELKDKLSTILSAAVTDNTEYYIEAGENDYSVYYKVS